ncbi:hypothetical protein A2334_01480 [Candidatus Roizmanbacteria bacterium RIFOXYB2_FULL_38_10]|uniref:Uncharacterized protein n=1 Tax=Candidatus Roizmanbacteria bacterium RIFOXYD1_FULL_38_12 TaxID=1802093 RepID=A0A1F7L269_9BACT|nr:MAG: hypothetical protein A3K47_05580 [Candidatus Roizmanbacteria bacterium RIFOXYA2_FULL_38_14]OGK64214.1 MAG: hypothetical protein A3K27_05580 [Candidatus Roizmanbacteria bacterium RIFOXYA1_FULL_37_12]OGK66060.1 MAG: hypothetical protein A3K38_05580 [Candidatus Roizmanbacteria bacterium RIFOXYB1_FULL_40_23]OGK68521.1 MAG: hypothetical protein A2334_01480 [Candidatus Roizmanbacteria bacterium RIFOXYB2_FULL_38_10]OGK70465.1 MAG: hypothetical protein A3K21_05585 [Candidatus Roizmanbacteria ba
MPKEFPGRIHGDGRVIMDDSFYSPVTKKQKPFYIKTLQKILSNAHIEVPIDNQNPILPDTLLALKQRFMIGFSNGCPWPEKAISEYLLEQATKPQTLEDLTTQIKESAHGDGKHSFLFQGLLRHASPELRNELLSYHPWQRLERQEDHNLPQDITDDSGKGAYGLAYNPPYFDVLIPLYKYIDDDTKGDTKQDRFFAVLNFFEKGAAKAQTITDLVNQAGAFLSNPQAYLKHSKAI